MLRVSWVIIGLIQDTVLPVPESNDKTCGIRPLGVVKSTLPLDHRRAPVKSMVLRRHMNFEKSQGFVVPYDSRKTADSLTLHLKRRRIGINFSLLRQTMLRSHFDALVHS